MRVDIDRTVEFLVGLLHVPSPAGDAGRAIRYVQHAFSHLPFQMQITPKGILAGTWDGEAYWLAGGDVRVALIGPGVDASHHYERTHRDSLEHTARLIAEYLLD